MVFPTVRPVACHYRPAFMPHVPSVLTPRGFLCTRLASCAEFVLSRLRNKCQAFFACARCCFTRRAFSAARWAALCAPGARRLVALVLWRIPGIAGIGPALFIECWIDAPPLVAAIATRDASRPRLEKERIFAFQKIVGLTLLRGV